MIRNFIKIALRSLFRHSSSSFINIAGLSIGLAATLMIFMWIQNELSYDRFFEDSDLLYRVEQDRYYDSEPYHVTVTMVPAGPEWKSRISQITDATRYMYIPRVLIEKDDIRLYESNVKAVDSSFFRMFSFKFLHGNPDNCLNQPNSIVITNELAGKYFPGKNPLGERITLEKQLEFIVTGVIEDLPGNTSLNFNAVIPFSFLYRIGAVSDRWGGNSITTFVKLTEGADITTVNKELTEIVKEHIPNSRSEVSVNPIRRIKLHSYFGYEKPVGSVIYIYIFGAIALFVLAIACINFINISTARSAIRSKEIGIKKVSGARKSNIRYQFLTESVLQVFVALLISLLLVGLLLQPFNTISGKEFTIGDMFSLVNITAYIILAIVTGLFAGLYPSFYLASFNPVNILKGERSGGLRGSRLRKTLVTVQFILSIFLATCGVAIYSQVKYMREMDTGFDKENTISIEMLDNVKNRYSALKERLQNHPLINGVSASSSPPYYFGSNSDGAMWEGKDPDFRHVTSYNAVDYDFTKTMGIEIKYGRSFSEQYPGDRAKDSTANFIINEELAMLIGKENPVGDWFSINGRKGTIVGVAKNFCFKPASEIVEPLVLTCARPAFMNNIVININPSDRKNAIEAIEKTWSDVIPDYPLHYKFVADEVDKMFRAEIRMSELFKYFTILAITLALLGLYGLSSYVAERKIAEIGIRKVMGATAPEVTFQLTGEFILLVLIALLLGLPLAWLYINNWITGFPNRITISPAMFIIVSAGSLFIAVLAVALRSYQAGNTNPADTLRVD